MAKIITVVNKNLKDNVLKRKQVKHWPMGNGDLQLFLSTAFVRSTPFGRVFKASDFSQQVIAINGAKKICYDLFGL